MKKADVKIGGFYMYRDTLVRIASEFNGAYRAQVVRSGKHVYISSARKLRPL